MITVLVVDDAAVDRRLVGELLLRKFPCTVEYAANGVEALAQMKATAPDLVITDMTMPMVDGLELVRSIRSHHPGIPVILMTAYGSETLAIEALEKGAASYVPKSQLAERLVDTVEEVLSLVRAERTHGQLLRRLTNTQFTFSLENDVALINPLVELVQEMVGGMNLADFTGRLQIGVALKEALLNALFHGNLEITRQQMQKVEPVLEEGEVSLASKRGSELPYRDRKIVVDVRLSSEKVHFVIRDEGPGFDTMTVPQAGDPSALEAEGGRGLLLMRNFMDEVAYNDAGNEVTMVKRPSST